MVVLHVYGDRSISLLFCDNQDTHGVKGGAGLLAGGEIGMMAGLSGHLGRVGASASSDRIRRPA